MTPGEAQRESRPFEREQRIDEVTAMDECPVNSRIECSRTLPPSFYRDPRVQEVLRERVFARAWHFVGEDALVRSPGDAHPFSLMEGCLDEPLLLVRGEDDVVRCVSNVCTHRAALVVEGPCRVKSLRCRYHGRRFGLDGRFEFMPEFAEAEGFPCEDDNLKALPVERLGPLLFTSLGPEVSFAEWMAPVLARVGFLPLKEFRFDASRSRDYLVKAHWALYCDNYLEGFHIPYVHHSLAESLDYSQYSTELFAHGNLQLGIASGGEEVFEIPAGWPDYGRRVAAFYFWLFPNIMLNFYPWGLSVNVVRPLAMDRTKVSFLSFVWDESKLASGAGAEIDRVEREDEDVVESVQRGVSSRLYKAGRFSPTREQGVHQFHRMLAARI
jgi:choline monooxygenase